MQPVQHALLPHLIGHIVTNSWEEISQSGVTDIGIFWFETSWNEIEHTGKQK